MKRLLPLVVALSMAAAPLAVAWCQIACAETASAVMSHTCHHHSSTGSAASHASASPATHLAAAPHACGHEDGVPVSQTALDAFAAPATLTQVFTPRQPAAMAPARVITPIARSSIPPVQHTPLRV